MTESATKDRRAELLDVAAGVFESSGIRASINEIADACGIQTGSLYHHFASKEAIILELVERYVHDLETLARDTLAEAKPAEGASIASIEGFGQAIADCAVRHRAALLLTFHEPPTVYGSALPGLAARIPHAITDAMRQLLEGAAATGALRRKVDRDVLADRLCQNMLHVGVGVFHRNPEAKQVPTIRCRMLLHGLAPGHQRDAGLERSAARRAADSIIASWPPSDTPIEKRDGHIVSVAREEFGRRGFQSTTVRDIAVAAGVSTKAVYRVARSKEDLLWRILAPFSKELIDARDAVLAARSSPLETLDALVWLNINTIDRFHAETNIVSAFLQVVPPTSPDLEFSTGSDELVPFAHELHNLEELLAAGVRAGELELAEAPLEVLARCVFALIWTPHNIVRQLGPAGALRFSRDTLIRGAASRRASR